MPGAPGADGSEGAPSADVHGIWKKNRHDGGERAQTETIEGRDHDDPVLALAAFVAGAGILLDARDELSFVGGPRAVRDLPMTPLPSLLRRLEGYSAWVGGLETWRLRFGEVPIPLRGLL